MSNRNYHNQYFHGGCNGCTNSLSTCVTCCYMESNWNLEDKNPRHIEEKNEKQVLITRAYMEKAIKDAMIYDITGNNYNKTQIITSIKGLHESHSLFSCSFMEFIFAVERCMEELIQNNIIKYVPRKNLELI